MTDEFPSRKEVYKMFYMTKGHFQATEETIYSCYWGYFRSAWHNEEFYNHGKGFEEAWKKLNGK